jgi:hypothetical protein
MTRRRGQDMEAFTITGSDLEWLVRQIQSGSVRTLGVAIDRGGVRVRINDEDVWSQPLGNRIDIAALPEP